MMHNPLVKIIKNRVPQIARNLLEMSRNELLVGVPRDKSERRDEKGQMSNATLAYIHDNGSPAANIPARPFMEPGIEAVQKEIQEYFKLSAELFLHEHPEAALKTMGHAGMLAKLSIQDRINEGIPPPLKSGTLRGRIRKRVAIKGAKRELKHRRSGGTATLTNAKPLIATGQLRNSINYVIRRK